MTSIWESAANRTVSWSASVPLGASTSMSLRTLTSPTKSRAITCSPPTGVPFFSTISVTSSLVTALLVMVLSSRTVPLSGIAVWVPGRPARVKSSEAWKTVWLSPFWSAVAVRREV